MRSALEVVAGLLLLAAAILASPLVLYYYKAYLDWVFN